MNRKTKPGGKVSMVSIQRVLDHLDTLNLAVVEIKSLLFLVLTMTKPVHGSLICVYFCYFFKESNHC